MTIPLSLLIVAYYVGTNFDYTPAPIPTSPVQYLSNSLPFRNRILTNGREQILKKIRVIIAVVCFVVPIMIADNSVNHEYLKKQQKEAEFYLFATGYYHPEEGQDFYATGSFEKDLKLNGRGITASGKKIKKGHAAVDPSIIPLGTEFYTEEHGILKAEDTGGNIKGNRIDIFTGNGRNGLIRALKIRGWLKVRILKWGNEKSLDLVPLKVSNIQHPDLVSRNKTQ